MQKRRKPKVDPTLAMIRRYFPKVNFVEDARRPAIVEVTDADNANADVKSHLTCALALACKRFFHADGVIIGLTTSWIIRGNLATRYRNAGTVSREITSFDRKAGFDAGRYLLTPASASNRLGVQRSDKATRKAKGGEPRRFKHYTRGVRASLGSHSYA